VRDVKGTTVSGVIRRSFRIGLWVGLLTGIGLAIAKIFRPKPEPSAVLDLGRPTTTGAHEWPPLEAAVATPTPVAVPQPDVEPVVATDEPGLVVIGDEPLQEPESPAPAAKKAAPKKKLEPWVDPDGNICPDTHPVKGKLSSMIFQIPGNFAYDRTNPDRCYQSADAATADGMRPAKR
jgi:hypothetical protein